MLKEVGLAFGLLAFSCAARAPKNSAPTKPTTAAVSARVDGCLEPMSVEALLAAHAQRYGSQQAILAALPRTFRGERTYQGQPGLYERLLDRKGHRDASTVRGLPPDASGVDASGFWEIEAGVAVRLRPPEAIEIALEGWLARREYLSAFDPERDSAKCAAAGGAPVLTIAFQIPELGNPELSFDLGSAALTTEVHSTDVGERASKTFTEWSQPDASGVRWSVGAVKKDFYGNTTELKIASHSPGLHCALLSRGSGAECLSPPPDRFALRWPKSGAVRVPMRFDSSELQLRALVDGRERWALLDTGAAITVIDSTAPLGPTFKPVLEIGGGAGTQTIRLGMGELASAKIGDLVAENLPAAAIPIPAFADFGNRRPEIVLGFSFFLSAAVKVDYAHQELTFAPSANALRSPRAVPLPVALLGGQIVAEAIVDGVSGAFVIDTGAGLTLGLAEAWARAHGFPGERRTTSLHGITDASTQESTNTILRIHDLEVGPIRTGSRIAGILSLPGHGRIAGLIGNLAFARCQAVVFDLPHRTMWFEPPCDRAMPEDRAGWRLVRKESPSAPGRPWVVGAVARGGAAERAGVQEGDRLLEAAGKPAALDVEVIHEMTRRPAGAKLELVVERGGVKRRLLLELADLLAE
jgi:predicted aspartyl protease